MIEVGQVGLAHIHGVALGHLQLHEVRRIRQRHARRVDEQAVGGLSVDDQPISVSVLADSEDAVDRLGRGGESHHACSDEPGDELDVLGAAAGNARPSQRLGEI